MEPRKVRLIVREHPGHQLYIRTIRIRQIPVPGVSEFGVAPRPKLLTGRNMVIRKMNDAGLLPMIVPAKEVVVGLGHHVRGRHRNVLVPGDVNTLSIVHSVIEVPCNRERGHCPLGMVRDVSHVGREKRLILIVYANADIRPPKKCLSNRCTVVKSYFCLDICLTRMQTYAHHPLHALHGLVLAEPDCDTPVLAVLDGVLRRHEGGRPMMLRPVELDTAGDPGAKQSNESRFDDMLPIKKIVPIRLVLPDVNTPANFRQDHQMDVLVFQKNGFVGFIRLLIGNPIRERVGIDLAAAALVNPLL